jgi:hypothetical protein
MHRELNLGLVNLTVSYFQLDDSLFSLLRLYTLGNVPPIYDMWNLWTIHKLV